MLQFNTKNEDYLDCINDYNLPIDELHFNPDNYSQYLDNEHYHHSDKGCDVEVLVLTDKRNEGNKSVNKLCHTHSKVCSKTGWELGWYQGTESKTLFRERTCVICGEPIYSHQKQVFCCSKCRPEYIRRKMRQKEERNRIKRERMRKLRLEYYEQRDRQKEINNAKSQISNDVRERSS